MRILPKVEIALKEVPSEISLVFNVTGCPVRCQGCHMPELQNPNAGIELTDELYNHYLETYKDKATCVLFMGGDWHLEELIEKLDKASELEYETALYTGSDLVDIPSELKSRLTYLKYGKWDNSKGGLDKQTTNQKLLNMKTGDELNYLFWD